MNAFGINVTRCCMLYFEFQTDPHTPWALSSLSCIVVVTRYNRMAQDATCCVVRRSFMFTDIRARTHPLCGIAVAAPITPMVAAGLTAAGVESY